MSTEIGMGREGTDQQASAVGVKSSRQIVDESAEAPRSNIMYLSVFLLTAVAAIALVLEPVPLDGAAESAARWTVVDSGDGAVQVKTLPVTLRASEMALAENPPAARQPLSAACPDLAIPSSEEPQVRHARPARAVPIGYPGHPAHGRR